MSVHFLAVDGGSQSTKVSVIDEVGTVHATARAPLRPYELGPGGRALHPDDDLWVSLVEAVGQVLASWPGEPSGLAAVGLCGIRSCRALVDGRGHLTEPVLSWMDDRVSRPLEELGPEVALVTSAGGYLARRLTGERRDSAASYRGMWPIDAETRRWSERRSELERTGMSRALLADLVDPGDLLGSITAEASAATGLPEQLPVFATANDKAVEALGAGMVEPGAVLLSLGTYVAAMTVAADSRPTSGGGLWSNASAVPGQTLWESAGIRRGMWTVSWLRDLLTAGTDDQVDPGRVQRRLEQQAWRVPPGSDGLFTVPDWLPPHDAPYRRGAFLGLHGSHGAPHLYRSVLEGIALTMRGHVDVLEQALESSPACLLLTGGGSRSDLMTQIVADVFGRRVERSPLPDTAGVGAAVCAAVGLGTHPDFPTAIARMVHPGGTTAPDPGRQRRYAELRTAYADLAEHTNPLFRTLAGSRW